MDDPERTFAQLLREYPHALSDRRRLEAFLHDLFPAREHAAFISALLAAYDLGIDEELAKAPNGDRVFSHRFVVRLQEERGLQKALAERAVEAWVRCLPPGARRVAPPPIAPMRPEPTPRPAPEPSPSPRSTPQETRQAAPSPQTAAAEVADYVPCGVGKQDAGFRVTGIDHAPECLHPQAGIYAVVFAYLQRSLDVPRGKYIEMEEERRGQRIGYARVYRLQMVLLLLIKNNYWQGDTLGVAYDGPAADLAVAIGSINHYARLFASLAGRSIRDLGLSVRPGASLRISLTPRPDGVCVDDVPSRLTTARMIWRGPHIRYRLNDANRSALLDLLQEAFGLADFRAGQIEALSSMLEADDRHSLCIMPTGAGKSLIFYLLAMLQSCPTFVICPTDLLIRDQLENLHRCHGIDDAVELPASADHGAFVPSNKLIYLTPYTFMHYQLIRHLIRLNYREQMGYVVLDEVHCISNWSHDFYPEYLMLSFNLRQFVDKTGYRCFTATADYTVVRDIQAQLGIRAEDVICPVPLAQGSRSFAFVGCDSEAELRSVTAARVAACLSQGSQRRTLVFTKTEDASRALHEQIRHDHSRYVDVYRAGDYRSYLDFAQGRSPALIAHADLGVGINLPQVTDTIHYGLPVSKSQYVQELGRAGRENAESRSTVVFLRRDAYPPALRAILRRTTPIEDLVEMCALDGECRDPLDALGMAIGGLDPPEPYYRGVLNVCHAIRRMAPDEHVVAFPVSDEEPFAQQAERYMRYLYVLYRVGYLYAWYIVRIDEASRTLEFFLDCTPEGESRRSLEEMNYITATYLHAMGAQEETIGAVRESRSEEETIRHYVDWYYRQFLYHHREQILEMQGFLETHANRSDSEILQALGNYFSLSLLDVQRDVTRATSLTIKDITLSVTVWIPNWSTISPARTSGPTRRNWITCCSAMACSRSSARTSRGSNGSSAG